MPDKSAIDSVASKFEAWARTLSPEEQKTLAEWWDNVRGTDVVAHTTPTWWEETGAWTRAWTDSWTTEGWTT
jgi:hypothetical protein